MSDIAVLYFLLLLLFVAIVWVPVFHYTRRRRRDLCEPVYLATAIFFIMFWVRSVYILIWGSLYLGERPFAPDIIESWNLVLLYSILACAVFYSTYYSKFGVALAHAVAPLPARWPIPRVYWLITILFGAGLASAYALVGQYGSLANFLDRRRAPNPLQGVGDLELLAYSMALSMEAAYVLLACRRKGVVLFASLFVIAVGFQFLQGQRLIVASTLLSLLVIYHYLRKPLRPRYLLGLGLLVALVVSPVMVLFREGSKQEVSVQSVSEALAPEGGPVSFLERLDGIDGFVFIVRDTPALMDYQYGKSYMYALIAWFPRRYWRDKPKDFEIVFTDTYFAGWFEPGVTGFSPTLLGEGYINFHVAGLLLVAGLGGLFWRAFYEYSIRRSAGMSGVFVYASALPFVLVSVEGRAVSLLTPAWIILLTSLSSVLMSKRELR